MNPIVNTTKLSKILWQSKFWRYSNTKRLDSNGLWISNRSEKLQSVLNQFLSTFDPKVQTKVCVSNYKKLPTTQNSPTPIWSAYSCGGIILRFIMCENEMLSKRKSIKAQNLPISRQPFEKPIANTHVDFSIYPKLQSDKHKQFK